MQARIVGSLGAGAAMAALGSGFTFTRSLVGYPVFAAQAMRYSLAAPLLAGAVMATGGRLVWPRGREWLWLVAVANAGLVAFNVALVRAVAEAEPAAVGVIVATVPLALALGEAVRRRRRPSWPTMAAVAVVVAGAVVVEGGGRTTAAGLAWSAVVLACEAGFTLLAVPVLDRLRPPSLSVHACWVAAVELVVAAVLTGGRALPPVPTGAQLLALVYLAVVLTALAFVAWYGAVRRLGSTGAGLFAGVVPVASALSGLAVGATTVTPTVLGGSAVVTVGIVLGLASLSGQEYRPSRERSDGPAEPRPVPSFSTRP